MSGRQVPWLCWAEWNAVRQQLFSTLAADVHAGIQKVDSWRCRGRLPLAIDITSSLLSIQIQDPVLCRAGKFVGASPMASRDSSLQSEYALAIIRLVNGISDSSQKGKLAGSVARLSEAAGLHPVLVDVRHEATHNNMPSLHLLRLAVGHALSWLYQSYWQGQAAHLERCQQAVIASLERLWQLHQQRQQRSSAASAADSDSDSDSDDPASTAAATTADLKKQQRAVLGELRGLLSDSFTPFLAEIMVAHGKTLSRVPPPPQKPQSKKRARAASAAADAGAGASSEASVDSAASNVRFTERHYPHLAVCLLAEAAEGARCALLAAARHRIAAPAAGTGPPQTAEPGQLAAAQLASCRWWGAVALAALPEPVASTTADALLGHVHSIQCALSVAEWEALLPEQAAGAEEGCVAEATALLDLLEAAIQGSGNERVAAAARVVRAHPSACTAGIRKRVVPDKAAAGEAAAPRDHADCIAQLKRARRAATLPGSALQSLPSSPGDGAAACESDGARKPRFRRVRGWRACPLGSLPGPAPGIGRPPVLTACAPNVGALAAAAAPEEEQQGGSPGDAPAGGPSHGTEECGALPQDAVQEGAIELAVMQDVLAVVDYAGDQDWDVGLELSQDDAGGAVAGGEPDSAEEGWGPAWSDSALAQLAGAAAGS